MSQGSRLVSYIILSHCLIVEFGMKIAKLEITMILALILCCYDYKLVDGSVKPFQPPQVNMNNNLQVLLWLDIFVGSILNQLFPYLREDLRVSWVCFRILRIACQHHEQLMICVFC